MSADDNLFLNLKILAKVQENGRICVKYDGSIRLEAESPLVALKRIWYGDTRQRTIDAIKTIIKQAYTSASILMNNKYTEIYLFKEPPIENCIFEHNKIINTLTLLKTELANANIGIKNLKNSTYKLDAHAISQLELVIYETDDIIDEINKKIHRVHDLFVKKDDNRKYPPSSVIDTDKTRDRSDGEDYFLGPTPLTTNYSDRVKNH